MYKKNQKRRKLTAEEEKMVREMDALIEMAKNDPSYADVEVPESLYYEIKRDIAEYEAEQKAIREQKEKEELIRLGRIYQKKRSYRKYYAVAAVAIMVLAFGITSFGGPERIFYNIKTMIAGREQEVVDSEGLISGTRFSEDEVLEQIETKLGTYPVKLNYLPNGVEFLEVNDYDELQGIIMYYGNGDTANIVYTIRANYRDGSWAKDVEDKLINEYQIESDYAVIKVKEYEVQNGTIRHMAMFEYNDVQYSLMLLDIEKEEVEKIFDNLYFM